MSFERDITFAAAVNDRQLFENNLLASPCLRVPHKHQILVQEEFSSAAKAYNDAIDKSVTDLLIFAHQDVYLPSSWLSDFERALDCLDRNDPNWGVLGCYGETLNDNGRGYVYSSGRGVVGKPFADPEPVQTLDEIVLIVRKSSGLRFDENLPHFHLYGADICLAAASRGMRSYAISAFCIHNTRQNLVLPEEFYECYRHIRRTWKDILPIQTTCIRVTKFNLWLYTRKLKEASLRLRRREVGGLRVNNIDLLLEELRSARQSYAPSESE